MKSPMEEICSCGKPLVLKTSWTDANPGRRFMAYQKYRVSNREIQLDGTLIFESKFDGCKKFSWMDPPACERCSQIILGLLRNINSKESDLKRMETRVLQLKKTIWKLQIACFLGLAVALISVVKS